MYVEKHYELLDTGYPIANMVSDVGGGIWGTSQLKRFKFESPKHEN